MTSKNRIQEILGAVDVESSGTFVNESGVDYDAPDSVPNADYINRVTQAASKNTNNLGINKSDISQQVGVDYAITEYDASKGAGYNAGAVASNTLKSGGQLVKDLLGVVLHPIKTAKNLGSLVDGTLDLVSNSMGMGAVGKVDRSEMAKQVGTYFSNRYGGFEKAKNTAIYDPLGFISDLSTVLAGGAGALKAGSKAAKVSGLGKVADTLSDVSRAIDPIEAMSKPVKKVISKTGIMGDGVKTAAKQEKILQGIQNSINKPAKWETSDIQKVLDAGYSADSPFAKVETIVAKADNTLKQTNIKLDAIKSDGKLKGLNIDKTSAIGEVDNVLKNGFTYKDPVTGEALRTTGKYIDEAGELLATTDATKKFTSVMSDLKKDLGKITDADKLLELRKTWQDAVKSWDMPGDNPYKIGSLIIDDVMSKQQPQLYTNIKSILNEQSTALMAKDMFSDIDRKILQKSNAGRKIAQMLPAMLIGGGVGGVPGFAAVAAGMAAMYKLESHLSSPAFKTFFATKTYMDRLSKLNGIPGKSVRFLEKLVDNLDKYGNEMATLERTLSEVEEEPQANQ